MAISELAGSGVATDDRILVLRRQSAPVPTGPQEWSEERDGNLTLGWAGNIELRFRPLPTFGPRVVEVTAVCSPSRPDELIALDLLLWTVPVALPYWDLEPLHGASFASSEGAIVLLGQSGAGKSTLSGTLARLGVDLLGDEVCPVDGEGVVWRGPPFIRTKHDPGRKEWGSPHTIYDGKEVFPARMSAREQVPAARLLILDPRPGSRQASVDPILGSGEGFKALAEHMRSPWALRDRRQRLHLAVLAKLSALPLFRVAYDRDRHPPTHVAEVVLESL